MMIKKVFNPDAVVLADGDYPKKGTLARKLLMEVPYVVCCDNAGAMLVRHGRIPDAIVGDGDSLSTSMKRTLASIWYKVSEQETNDLSKAMRFLLVRRMKKVAIVGATGKREDHTLGNISLLIDYMHMDFDVRMYTNTGVFIPCMDDNTIEVDEGKSVSIFSFGAKDMKSDGLKYPLHDLTNWWQGTLNESVSDKITVRAKGDYLVFIKA